MVRRGLGLRAEQGDIDGDPLIAVGIEAVPPSRCRTLATRFWTVVSSGHVGSTTATGGLGPDAPISPAILAASVAALH